MFPEIIEETDREKVLVGLKIIKVISTPSGIVKKLECIDDASELHDIEFLHGTIKVDGETVLPTNQGFY
jgi:hypothetical protein